MKSKDFVTKILKGKSIPMGLSAGQARLLSITARKSDCEYRSMQLSHQKLAISRQLEDISNEYQNSLDQTKLIYDYYGTGTTNTQLSYGILMNPSELNEYMPNLLTDSSGRVVLNSSYAAAAAAAGIPKEGLNGLPSTVVRNKFIDALANENVISATRADKFKNTSYNQLAGLGAISSVSVTTTEVSYTDLIDMLSTADYRVDPTVVFSDENLVRKPSLLSFDSSGKETTVDLTTEEINLGDVLTGDYVLLLTGQDGKHNFNAPGGLIDTIASSEFWTVLQDSIAGLLDTGDPYIQACLAYANEQMNSMLANLGGDNNVDNFAFWNTHKKKKKSKIVKWVKNEARVNGGDGYIGLCGERNKKGDYNSGISINLSSMAKSYLTFFAQKMQGLASSTYYVGETVGTSNFVDDTFTFLINTGTTVSEDEMRIINFYDTILNQICTRGWTENANVDDNTYLQEMLQNGMMYLTKVKDDGYYYQGNYATDSYIKTVEDETFIAQAEAKYQTEKQRLSSKENSLDLKMKNLDTEISALTTEYDTVKGTITKNIERTFKRYSA